MIFNLSQGGESTISITAPSGVSVSASTSGESVSGSGTCNLKVHVIGTYTVSCTIGGVTKSVSVDVTSFGQTKTQQFSKLTITAPGGTISCDGVSRSGSGDLPVAGTGSKTITCVYSGAPDKSTSFTVTSGTTTYSKQFSVINVSGPGGSTFSCESATRSGNGGLLVVGTGSKSVKCTYDSVEHTNSVSVSSGTTSYSTSFSYSCTISVACPSGASVVASRSGYSNVPRTGPGTLSVPKSGNWTVTVTIGSGIGQTSKSATVSAAYDTTKNCSLYPKYFIFKAGSGGGYKPAGLQIWDADGAGGAVEYNNSYADYTCSDGGNNTLIASNNVALTGYTAIKIHCKLEYANRVELGLTAWDNRGDANNWTYRNTIHALTSADNRVNWDWNTYSISINSTASIRPVLLNLGGGWIPSLSDDFDSEVLIDEWWLE